MKSYTIFNFRNGEKFTANISAKGTRDTDKKADCIAHRLSNSARGNCKEWTTYYNDFINNREFARVNSRGFVSGIVYDTTSENASILKRLN
ncbi:hypothetical protein DRH27_05575 [Candidatus Falkowbacteria bacterium]|nr:MAG: hypothetical protein DRH27_05575 [Candidatus Falkowbacteria bacterium]